MTIKVIVACQNIIVQRKNSPDLLAIRVLFGIRAVPPTRGIKWSHDADTHQNFVPRDKGLMKFICRISPCKVLD